MTLLTVRNANETREQDLSPEGPEQNNTTLTEANAGDLHASSSSSPRAQNNNNNTSLIIIDTDELTTNNETQIIQKIIDEYERRLQEQVALAREDIVHELEQQIQVSSSLSILMIPCFR